MRITIILITIFALTACVQRMDSNKIQISCRNDNNLFQADVDTLRNAIASALAYRLEKQKKYTRFANDGDTIEIEFISDKVTHYSSWLWGSGYDRYITYKLLTKAKAIECRVYVNNNKDGAADRALGHMTGFGSHPGKAVFPGTLGPIIDAIADDLVDRLE